MIKSPLAPLFKRGVNINIILFVTSEKNRLSPWITKTMDGHRKQIPMPIIQAKAKRILRTVVSNRACRGAVPRAVPGQRPE